MKRLPRLTNSGILTQPQWEAVARVIEDNFREVTLQPGVGYTLKNGPGGSSLVVNNGGGSASSAAAPSPFDVTLVPVEVSGGSGGSTAPTSYTATIRPGTVNGILPSNIFDSFTIEASQTTYFKAVAATNGKVVTSVSIVADDQAPAVQVPVPQALPAGFEVLFAVSAQGTVFRTLAPGSSIVAGPNALFVADRSGWTPGHPLTETWYAWSF